MYVGTTDITLTNGDDTKKVKITVQPKSTLYSEPNLSFGESRSSVKSKCGTPTDDTETSMIYLNYSTSELLICMFDESDRLTAYAMVFGSEHTSEITEFLSERYVVDSIDPSSYMVIYRNALQASDATMLIGTQLTESLDWMVMYIPYDNTNGTPYMECTSKIMSSIKVM